VARQRLARLAQRRIAALDGDELLARRVLEALEQIGDVAERTDDAAILAIV